MKKGKVLLSEENEFIVLFQSYQVKASEMHWYRTFFIAFEAAIFAVFAFLRDFQISTYKIIIAFIGIILAIVWIFICNSRGKTLDKQADLIRQYVNKYEDLNRILSYVKKKEWISARIIFNYIFPVILVLFWISIALREFHVLN